MIEGTMLIHTKKIAKIEEPDLNIPKVDTIVSEPIGVLLFHERMVCDVKKNRKSAKVDRFQCI
jgi:hypothetical protein